MKKNLHPIMLAGTGSDIELSRIFESGNDLIDSTGLSRRQISHALVSQVVGIVITIVSFGQVAAIRPGAPGSSFSGILDLDIAVASFSDMDLGKMRAVPIGFFHQIQFVNDEIGEVARVFASGDGRGIEDFNSATARLESIFVQDCPVTTALTA